MALDPSIKIGLPQLKFGEENPSCDTFRSHQDFDAYVVKLLNGRALETLQAEQPQLYATIRCIESIHTLFAYTNTLSGLQAPARNVRADTCSSLASPLPINIPDIKFCSAGELEACLSGRTHAEQLKVSSKKAVDTAEEAKAAIDQLQPAYSAFPELGNIQQVLVHLISLHPTVFQAGGLVEQWAPKQEYIHSQPIEWIEKYAILCQLITYLARKAKAHAQEHEADPKILNKLGILTQMLVLYMDKPVPSLSANRVSQQGMYQFFSKASLEEEGEKMPACPIRAWSASGETLKSAEEFLFTVAENCAAFHAVEEMHKHKKSDLLNHILNPVGQSTDAWDLWR
ncbi:MAG: hypothetical protein P0S96_03975 [Simkaniaceae bacterium]|nr:hypothetical protein [Candidatus Sacchlamyda saccharinae]